MSDETTNAPIRTEIADGVATIVFNRPDNMNSLDIAAKEAFRDTLRQVAEDPAVRCVVLTGEGRAFCVGQDLKEHIELQAEDPVGMWSTVAEHYNPAIESLATMNKPVIAAINGVAAGAGAAFAFAADVRIMVDSGGINLAFPGIGLSCDSATSWNLPRLVGIAKAKELLFFPRTVKAPECLELGLVNQVVSAEELMPTAMEMARKLAAGPTLSYGAMRQAIAYSATHDLTDSLAKEHEFMTATGTSDDHKAAVQAFIKKEKPVFEGR